MTIGEALKDERLKLNLTQKEMAANIMSRSQYGKVEKDLHDISASVLLKLLEFHHISPDFFFKQVLSPQTGKDSETQLLHELKTAFFEQNTNELNYLFGKAEKMSLSKFTIYQIILLKAMLTQNVKDVPSEVKNYIQFQLFKNENWSNDLMMLSFFGSATMFLSPESLDIYMTSVIKKYSNISTFSLKVQKLISSVTLNYLYYTHSFPNKKNWYQCFTLLDNLSIDPSLSHYRIINLYFKAFLKKDFIKLQAIKSLLEECGDTRISSLLPK